MTRTKLTIITILTALLSAASIYGIYYTHQLPTEETTTTTLCAYENIGNYDYIAALKPNNLYNQTTLKPGEGTLYTRIIEHIDVTFTYTFQSSRPAEGTIEYRITTALETPRWNKTLTTIPPNTITLTQELKTSHLLNLTTYEEIVRTIDKETGTTTSEYSLVINHHIHTQAKTDVGTIDQHFTPTLKITFKPRSPEGDIITIEGLNHTSPGAITQTKKIPLPGVMYQRYASYAFSAIIFPALVYTIWMLTKAKPIKEKPLKETTKPYEEIIAEAKEPSPRGKVTVAMKTLEDLAKVSESLGKPILHSKKEQTHIFYVLDADVRYEFTAEEIAETIEPKKNVAKNNVKSSQQALISLHLLRIGAAVAFTWYFYWAFIHEVFVWNKLIWESIKNTQILINYICFIASLLLIILSTVPIKRLTVKPKPKLQKE